jgi:hypothetical protein
MVRIGVIVAALAACATVSAPASARHVTTCWPRASKTVELSRTVRIFSTHLDDVWTRYYACDLRRRNRIGLGEEDEFYSGPGDFRLAGNVVGFVAVDPGTRSGGYDTSDVTVARVRGGMRRSVYYMGTVVEFAVLPSGTAAWIGRRGDSGVLEVHVFDANGDRILDSGGSLAALAVATPATVYWTRDGMAQRATAG